MVVTRKTKNTRRGFTLVELMVAMLITGIVSVVIYSLFDTTSDNFLEVDQLSEVDDKLRFSMQRIRTDLQMAGSQMTPDSDLDPFVMPRPPGGVRFAGIMPYGAWQDTQPSAILDSDIATANPNVGFDGIVVMGAFDFPLSFEVRGLADGDSSDSTARIDAHYRGLMRLRSANPFSDGLSDGTMITSSTQVEFLEPNWDTRLIRVFDRQGFLQIMHPDQPLDVTTDFAPPAPNEDWHSLGFALPEANDPLGPKYKQTSASGLDFGLDRVTEDDVGYDAGLIDAYWYHVIQDPQDSHNYQLVRERLCAAAVVQNFGGAPSTMTLSQATACPSDEDEFVVVADHVADFQIWFDCATDATGAVVDAPWSSAWLPPSNPGICVNGGISEVGRARVAHVRLSVHTPSERKDQAHIQFETTGGATATGNTANLRTFDSYPNTPGAARVSTLQADFELPNFVARNLTTQQP